MLKKRNRLRATEVAAVLKAGRSARSAHMQLKFIATALPFRCAAIVPKALARKAVARNSLRRAVYRAVAATDTSRLRGNALLFVKVVPVKNLTATFAAELPQLVSSLVSSSK